MTFRSEVAAKVRAHREKHPELYCRFCLWRISTPYNVVPCPRHTLKLVPGENRRADFDDVSTRTEIIREGDRVCLSCLRPIEGAKPYPAAAPAFCDACNAQRAG